MAKLRPLKAIREKCVDCCGGQRFEVRRCPVTDCTLWEYRMGHRPKDAETDSASENAHACGNSGGDARESD